MFLCLQTQPFINTCLESPTHPHTHGVVFHRYNIVICYVSSEFPRKGDGGSLICSTGSVPVDQVGVGWVCTIVNGAGVPWPKECALHKDIAWISCVNMYIKNVNIYATCGGRSMTLCECKIANLMTMITCIDTSALHFMYSYLISCLIFTMHNIHNII